MKFIKSPKEKISDFIEIYLFYIAYGGEDNFGKKPILN